MLGHEPLLLWCAKSNPHHIRMSALHHGPEVLQLRRIERAKWGSICSDNKQTGDLSFQHKFERFSNSLIPSKEKVAITLHYRMHAEVAHEIRTVDALHFESLLSPDPDGWHAIWNREKRLVKNSPEFLVFLGFHYAVHTCDTDVPLMIALKKVIRLSNRLCHRNRADANAEHVGPRFMRMLIWRSNVQLFQKAPGVPT